LPTGSWPAMRPRRERQPTETGPGSSGQEIASTLTSADPKTGRSAVGRPASCLSFCLIHLRPAPFTRDRSGHVRAGHGRWWTSVNGAQHCWKACWGQPLASSNLASSATSDQAIHKTRSCVRPGLARLRSLIHSTHIGIKRPKMQVHASERYRGCGRPLGVPALSDQLAAVAVMMGERLGSDDARCLPGRSAGVHRGWWRAGESRWLICGDLIYRPRMPGSRWASLGAAI
jgi:hypothetical protein